MGILLLRKFWEEINCLTQLKERSVKVRQKLGRGSSGARGHCSNPCPVLEASSLSFLSCEMGQQSCLTLLGFFPFFFFFPFLFKPGASHLRRSHSGLQSLLQNHPSAPLPHAAR